MIGFLTGAIGKWLSIGLIGSLLLTGAYILGYTKGNSTCEYKIKYAQALAERRAAEEELAKAEIIAEAKEKLAARYQERMEDAINQKRDLEKYIEGLPAGTCELPDDFLHSLTDQDSLN